MNIFHGTFTYFSKQTDRQIARIKITVGVAYGSDIKQVLSLLKEAAENDPRVLSNPEPNPLFLRFGDNALVCELHSRIVNVKDLLSVRSALCQEIASSFQAAGIEIPFPPARPVPTPDGRESP